MSSDRLNVIALISGGKDSFFSLLHCLRHGHRVVALANLFPGGPPGSDGEVQFIDPGPARGPDPDGRAPGQDFGCGSDRDLNSFMYQTVGHEIIPLYAGATGLPLYRQAISRRGAVRHERDYEHDHQDGHDSTDDETESMLPLLQAVVRRHPEANALCAGAILSTYQRTRVESVARRLGLTPLAFLWQYPALPPPEVTGASASGDETQLLRDMAQTGLDARIIKVASAGLDEGHLWERVSSHDGARRIKAALRKFGSARGAAALGEGGEFETIVVDGPSPLFRSAICVPDEGRRVIHEGGGCSWLALRGAHLEAKVESDTHRQLVRAPDLLDAKFKSALDALSSASFARETIDRHTLATSTTSSLLRASPTSSNDVAEALRWSVLADPTPENRSVQEETSQIVEKIRALLRTASLEPSQITNVIIVLRHMSDFPRINDEYGRLFTKANPPSRVTISCGDLLPHGSNIAVHLTAPSSRVDARRNGLHVQSRSYWAPANIGPYSQAIDTCLAVQFEATGLRSITIAGQIPLIPATMLLPPPSEKSHELQIVLSLQHLWRVALEMKVQYWTSAVAYFARSSTIDDMSRNAKLTGAIWEQIHGSPEDEDDDEVNGPDVWDLKYNSQFLSLGGHDEQKSRSLPDWPILTLQQQNDPKACVPPVFAVEVEELPRQAAVEWHAHAGLSQVKESCVELITYNGVGASGWRTWHLIVKGENNAALVYSTLALRQGASTQYQDIEADMGAAFQESLGRLQATGSKVDRQEADLIYMDAVSVEVPWARFGNSTSKTAIIPCRSIWSSQGERQVTVALYKTSFYA